MVLFSEFRVRWVVEIAREIVHGNQWFERYSTSTRRAD